MQGRQHVFLFYGNNSNGSIKVGILSFFSGTSVAIKCKAASNQLCKSLFLCISEIIAIKFPFLIEYSISLLINSFVFVSELILGNFCRLWVVLCRGYNLFLLQSIQDKGMEYYCFLYHWYWYTPCEYDGDSHVILWVCLIPGSKNVLSRETKNTQTWYTHLQPWSWWQENMCASSLLSPPRQGGVCVNHSQASQQVSNQWSM